MHGRSNASGSMLPAILQIFAFFFQHYIIYHPQKPWLLGVADAVIVMYFCRFILLMPRRG